MQRKGSTRYLFSVKMVNTKSMTQAKEQAKANAKIAQLTLIKSKVPIANSKMSSALRKLKKAVPDYLALIWEVGEETERDEMVVVIQRNWPKLEDSSDELQYAMAELLDAISKATATELNEDPNKMTTEQKKEIVEITTEYLTFQN